MTKTATAKRTAKTASALNRANPALALDNPKTRMSTQDGPDVAQPTPHHSEKTPGGSPPAAASKPRTRGDSRMSRTVPTASARAPSLSSRRSQSSSRHNRARDPNPSRDDLAATHLSPFKFIPRQAATEVLNADHSTPCLRPPEVQGGTSRARQVGPSRHDCHDHASHGRNANTAQPLHRSSPSQG